MIEKNVVDANRNLQFDIVYGSDQTNLFRRKRIIVLSFFSCRCHKQNTGKKSKKQGK